MKKKKRKGKRIRNPDDQSAITEQVPNCAKTKFLVGIEMYQN